MKLLSLAFLLSLLLGQIGGISVAPGVVVYVHDVLLGVLLGAWAVQKKKRSLPALSKPILFFAGAAALSLLVNAGRFTPEQLGVGSLYLVRWVFYAGVYVLVLQKYLKVEEWLYGLFAVGVGFGVLGLIQFFAYPDLRNLMYLGWDPHFYRLFSTLLDPNFTGIILVLAIFLGFYLRNKRYVLLGQVVSLVALVLTYSRSSFLALIGAGCMFAMFKKKWNILFWLTAFVVIVAIIPKPWGATLNLFRVDSTVARFGSWQHGLALFVRSPVVGYGFNTVRYTQGTEGAFVSKSNAGVDSSILFIAATTGLLGLAAYGYLIFSMARLGGALGFVYTASLIALGIHSLFVNSAFYPWILIWFWILTGVAERKTRHL